MRRLAQDSRWILLTALVTGLLGLQVTQDLLADDVGPVKAISASLVAPIKGRSPASLSTQFHVAAPLVGHESLVKWNCREKTFPGKLNVDGTEFRFRADGCGKDMAAESVIITNETNGFTATVFATGDRGFETDLIQLNTGENHLRLKATSGKMPAKERQWSVFSIPKDLKLQE